MNARTEFLAEILDDAKHWPTWQRDLWLGAVWFVVVFPAYVGIPAARPWLVGTIGAAALAGLAAWGLDLHRDLRELDAENTRLHLLLTELQIAAPVPYVPTDMPARLWVVPEQRTGEHDHLKADDDWFARLYNDKGDLR